MKHKMIWHKKFRNQKMSYWQDMGEMHTVMHSFPGYVKAVILELLDGPMTREEIWDYLHRFGQFERRFTSTRGSGKRQKKLRNNLKEDIARAIDQKVLAQRKGRLFITPGGLEMAQHMQEAVPQFIGSVFSPKTVSIFTIVVHVLLTVIKCTLGIILHSAGLMADGIDNGVDTLSSVFVWIGIKLKKERFISFLIVAMMFFSLSGIAMASYNKIVNPGPVKDGVVAFIVSALCGTVMLLLSIYQFAVGKRNANFAIMCQSVDSRNHFLISLLVCGGIILSLFAERYRASYLYYADAAASIIIGFLILKSAIELLIELLKRGGEPEHIRHFMRHAQEKMRRKIILSWLSNTLRKGPDSLEQLEDGFRKRFCEKTPKIFILTGFGYQPESSNELHRYLDYFMKKGKIVFERGQYRLP